MSYSDNSKRIAKNTGILYVRMSLTMLVSLFTTRIVLDSLGIIDYGIYNVVGGIVVMFSFLSNTMASASQRFFAFELGKNNIGKLKETFSLTLLIYFIISLVVLILAETVGLWFLNTKMTIPIERLNAANWVYQFSILSFIITIMTIPYNSVIIARENMSLYAYVSVLEVFLKLIIAYLLVFFDFDKLKIFAVLSFLATCIITFTYRVICRKKYNESRFGFIWNKQLFKTLISFSGWNLFGAVSGVLNNQGINIILNIFYGPIINASRGIAQQINYSVNLLVMNFHTAVQPQITKYFALGEKDKMEKLVFQSSKFSFFLLLVITMPVLIETKFILDLWLSVIPDNVVIFIRLIIISSLIDSLTYSMQTAAQATGKIKMYQIIVGGMLLMNLPISLVLLEIGFPPQSTYVVSIIISFICLILRLWMLRILIDFSVKRYFKDILSNAIIITLLVSFIPLLFYFLFDATFLRFLLVAFTSVLLSIIVIYYFGLSKTERSLLSKAIKERLINR